MKSFKTFWFVVLLLILPIGTASAGQYSASLGAIAAPDYEGSEDYTFIPALSLRGNYDNGLYFSIGRNFKFNLVPGKRFNFGPVLNYRQERDDVDNDQIAALKNVDAAFEAGFFGSFNHNNFSLGLEVLTDASNEHNGSLVKATMGYRWQAMSELMISPTIHMTYADDDYMATYFSVDSGNRGSSTLPNFKASGGIKDVGLNIVANYSTPWPQWGIMGVFGYKMLLNDAKESSIVDEEGDQHQMVLGLMATYRWEM